MYRSVMRGNARYRDKDRRSGKVSISTGSLYSSPDCQLAACVSNQVREGKSVQAQTEHCEVGCEPVEDKS